MTPEQIQARGEASAAARLGMRVETYRRMRASGYRWCTWCGCWEWHELFSAASVRGSRSYCVAADRFLSRERSRAYRRRKRAVEAS